MKLVVGLGNPGEEYKTTRHNIGFLVLDNYLGDITWSKKRNSLFYKTKDTVFLKPLSYMNNSGQEVLKIMKYFKIKTKDALIVQDDFDMLLGTYKLKNNSSSGGHNGIDSIIKNLKTNEFGRLKIGILNERKKDACSFVLSKFTKEELNQINYKKFNEIIDSFIENGFNYTLNNYKNEKDNK